MEHQTRTRSYFLGTMGMLSPVDQAIMAQYKEDHSSLFMASKSEDLECDNCGMCTEVEDSVGSITGECWGCYKDEHGHEV